MRVYRENGEFFCNIDVLKDFRKYIGLMFRRDIPEGTGILLELNSNPIHSFFVFFTFRAIFLDVDMRIVEDCFVRPFWIKSVEAKWVLETRVNKKLEIGEKLIIR